MKGKKKNWYPLTLSPVTPDNINVWVYYGKLKTHCPDIKRILLRKNLWWKCHFKKIKRRLGRKT